MCKFDLNIVRSEINDAELGSSLNSLVVVYKDEDDLKHCAFCDSVCNYLCFCQDHSTYM